MSKLAGRLATIKGVLSNGLGVSSRPWPAAPRRILVAHRLLLGDTLMLTPLLKKLRLQYPQAAIAATMRKEILPLYSAHPYGVQALGFDPNDVDSVNSIIRSGPYDLGIVPGDNRYSWLARAAGCRHIVAHAGDRPAWKSWPIDTEHPMSAQPATWAEMVAQLVPGPPAPAFDPGEWPTPPWVPFQRPTSPYAVLHLGATNLLRTWFAPRWFELAQQLTERGLVVVWSAGPNETGLVAAADPSGKFASFAGKTDLPQLLHLLKHASLVVCPDSGVAHLSRLTATPSVVLYGPASERLVGTGRFWNSERQKALIEEDFPCRDQQHLFKRELAWVRRCDRRAPACTFAKCMEPLSTQRVLDACDQLLDNGR
ncbi:MAG: glycosyltransferase family 9 protein [Burkholderiales bacterium]|nr:MAG: glycosyltransferase family 9 protein [Burkholderiales bacterium]